MAAQERAGINRMRQPAPDGRLVLGNFAAPALLSLQICIASAGQPVTEVRQSGFLRHAGSFFALWRPAFDAGRFRAGNGPGSPRHCAGHGIHRSDPPAANAQNRLPSRCTPAGHMRAPDHSTASGLPQPYAILLGCGCWVAVKELSLSYYLREKYSFMH